MDFPTAVEGSGVYPLESLLLSPPPLAELDFSTGTPITVEIDDLDADPDTLNDYDSAGVAQQFLTNDLVHSTGTIPAGASISTLGLNTVVSTDGSVTLKIGYVNPVIGGDQQPNVENLLIVEVVSGTFDPTKTYVDASSGILGEPDISPDANIEYSNMVCFARGTFIKTIDGERFIENLSVGDLVFTQDSGYQPIRWIGNRRLSRVQLVANPKLKPIRIEAGALGNGLPERDLLVSPQHRILLRNIVVINMFGVSELLMPAIKLLALPGVDIEEDCAGVEYYHMLFDRHEIIFANGSPTESLFTGPEALKAVSPEARAEISALFPEILEPDFEPTPARFIPEKGKDMKNLAMRLAKNTHHAPYEQAGQ
jgi:hypothetical protein